MKIESLGERITRLSGLKSIAIWSEDSVERAGPHVYYVTIFNEENTKYVEFMMAPEDLKYDDNIINAGFIKPALYHLRVAGEIL